MILRPFSGLPPCSVEDSLPNAEEFYELITGMAPFEKISGLWRFIKEENGPADEKAS